MIRKPAGRNHTFVIENQSQLKQFAAQLTGLLHAGDVLALIGPMGSGKTTLTQYLSLELGSKANVCSPTFGLLNEYDSLKGPIHHVDFYRLEPMEIETFAWELESQFHQTQPILILEWADLAPQLSHLWTWQITLSKLPFETHRQMDVIALKEQTNPLAQGLETDD